MGQFSEDILQHMLTNEPGVESIGLRRLHSCLTLFCYARVKLTGWQALENAWQLANFAKLPDEQVFACYEV